MFPTRFLPDKFAIRPVAIPPQTIEQIAAANDIVDVIGSYFPLKRAGANFKALCPFHQEKTPSFHVSPQRQTFHCFGCGVGGSVFRFVMDYEHVDFPSAVRKLAGRAGITIVEEHRSEGEDRQLETRRLLLKLHAETAQWFQENLLKKDWAAAARDYLKRRGVDRDVAKNWQLGFAPDAWDGFLKWALERGYSREQLLQSGLVKPRDDERPQSSEVYDRFRGRIMFPICNDVGEVIAFSGRLLPPSPRLRRAGESDAQAAKYLNSPETPLFRKGRVLFGLHKTKRALIEANCAIVCEGQLDLIALFEAGLNNVVAPQGTAFTPDQARLLKRYVDEVVLCFDADEAGQKAGERSLDALLENDLIVRVAELPAGQDPDSLVRREGKDAFDQRLAAARDFFDHWIDHKMGDVDLNSIGAKTQAARDLAATVSHVRDPITRGQVVNKVSARLGIATSDFAALVSRQPTGRAPVVNEPAAQRLAAPPHEVAMLCRLALRDDAARKFLLEQNWREVLAQTPEAQLLIRILESDLRPDDPPSLNAFMAELSPAEEGLVSSWILQKLPPEPLALVQQWWNGLRGALVRRQLQVAEGRMRLPDLSTGEVLNLQKQILDLREQLHELSAAFSSAREAGT
jgi:DNA primase